MKISSCVLAIVAFAGNAATAQTTKHYDFASFDAAANVISTNTFDSVATGAVQQLDFTAGSVTYTITATGPGGGQLFVHDGFLSTESGLDGILITFTSGSVTAIGGNGWAVDATGQNTGGYLSIELSDGTNEVYSSTGPQNFQGFTSSAPIQSIFLEMPGDNLWVGYDNLLIGSTVPSPTGAAVLGLGVIGIARRRR